LVLLKLHKLRWLLVIVPVLLLAACAAPKKPEPEPELPPVQAEREGANSPQAKKLYAEGLLRLRAGDAEGAVVQFSEFLTRYGDAPGARANLSLGLYGKGDYAAAKQELERAIEQEPLRAPLHNQLGLTLRQLGEFDAARRAYERAAELDPTMARAYRNLAILYDLYFHDMPGAVQQYKRYQELLGAPDPQVAGWIEDLERRIKAAEKRQAAEAKQ
jgi:Flp pilus assembly protein TadD